MSGLINPKTLSFEEFANKFDVLQPPILPEMKPDDKNKQEIKEFVKLINVELEKIDQIMYESQNTKKKILTHINEYERLKQSEIEKYKNNEVSITGMFGGDTPNPNTTNLDTPNLDTPNPDTTNLDTPNLDTPNLDTTNQDTTNQDITNQDTINQDTTNQDITNQDTTNQDTTNQDTTNQDTTNQDTTNQDITNQDTTNQDTTNQDTPNQDTTNQDTPNPNTTNQDTTNQDITNQDTTNQDTLYNRFKNSITRKLNRAKTGLSSTTNNTTRKFKEPGNHISEVSRNTGSSISKNKIDGSTQKDDTGIELKSTTAIENNDSNDGLIPGDMPDNIQLVSTPKISTHTDTTLGITSDTQNNLVDNKKKVGYYFSNSLNSLSKSLVSSSVKKEKPKPKLRVFITIFPSEPLIIPIDIETITKCKEYITQIYNAMVDQYNNILQILAQLDKGHINKYYPMGIIPYYELIKQPKIKIESPLYFKKLYDFIYILSKDNGLFKYYNNVLNWLYSYIKLKIYKSFTTINKTKPMESFINKHYAGFNFTDHGIHVYNSTLEQKIRSYPYIQTYNHLKKIAHEIIQYELLTKPSENTGKIPTQEIKKEYQLFNAPNDINKTPKYMRGGIHNKTRKWFRFQKKALKHTIKYLKNI